MIRYFYWFQGTPKNRPHGPWWFKDFTNNRDYQVFRNEMIFLLKQDFTIRNCTDPELCIFDINPFEAHLKKLLKGDLQHVEAYDYTKGCSII